MLSSELRHEKYRARYALRHNGLSIRPLGERRSIGFVMSIALPLSQETKLGGVTSSAVVTILQQPFSIPERPHQPTATVQAVLPLWQWPADAKLVTHSRPYGEATSVSYEDAVRVVRQHMEAQSPEVAQPVLELLGVPAPA